MGKLVAAPSSTTNLNANDPHFLAHELRGAIEVTGIELPFGMTASMLSGWGAETSGIGSLHDVQRKYGGYLHVPESVVYTANDSCQGVVSGALVFVWPMRDRPSKAGRDPRDS